MDPATPAATMARMETRANRVPQQNMNLGRTRSLPPCARSWGFDSSLGWIFSLTDPAAGVFDGFS